MIKMNKNIVIVSIVLIIFYIVYYLITGYGVPCLFHKLTNLYCPGCGITRMFLSLVQLDFYQAFRYNPLMLILLIISIVYYLLKFIVKKLYNKKIEMPNYAIYALLVIVFMFWIARNIPIFDFLIPTLVN